MDCEFCGKKIDDLYLFVLPCGYSVCYKHFLSQEVFFNCFICDEHIINKKSCFQMQKNRKKMEKISFIEKKKDILNICDQIDQFKLDQKSFIVKESDDIINKIDLKREVLKTNLNKLVDNYYESLLNDVKEKQLNIIDSIKADFEGINTQEIRDKLNLDSDNNLTDYQVQIESLVNLRSSHLDEHLKNFHNFKNIEFFEGEEEPQVIMPKLFGTIDLKDSNDSFRGNSGESAYSKTPSNEFKLIAQVGLENNLELNNGEIVFTSQSNKSNLLIFNPQSGNICDVPTQHDIKYLFKSDNNEIITIDSEFHVKIWNNFKCVNNYFLVRKNLIYAELIEGKIITITEDYFVTFIKYNNGEILEHFYLTKPFSEVKFIKAFSTFIILIEVNDRSRFNEKYLYIKKINLRNEILQTSKPETLFEKEIERIERLNENEFVTGSSNGKLCIWNSDLSVKLNKQCHSSAISTIKICENGNIASISSRDGIIKIWNSKDLNLIYQSSLWTMENSIYGNLLKDSKFVNLLNCGKLVFSDSDNNAYITNSPLKNFIH